MSGNHGKEGRSEVIAGQTFGYLDALPVRTVLVADNTINRANWVSGSSDVRELDNGDTCPAKRADAAFGTRPCGRPAKADWLDAEYGGEWVPACGIHARVAERQGHTVEWRK